MNNDYTKDNLPIDYHERAKYIVKHQRGQLLSFSLLSVLFILPTLAWILVSRYVFPGMWKEEMEPYLFSLMVNIPLIFIAFFSGFGQAGLYYSLRRMLQSDTATTYHFFKGFKESGFEFGLFNTIYALVYIILDSLLSMSINLGTLGYILCFILYFIVLTFLSMTQKFVLTSASMYIVSIPQAYRDAFGYEFKNFKNNILKYMLFSVPFLLLFFKNFGTLSIILNIIGVAAIILVFNVITPLFYLAETISVYDEHINKNTYPENYRKGLRK